MRDTAFPSSFSTGPVGGIYPELPTRILGLCDKIGGGIAPTASMSQTAVSPSDPTLRLYLLLGGGQAGLNTGLVVA
jgi:hypothetical protein